MSNWTHVICEDCWNAKNPDREPVRITQEYATEETYCYCGKKTSDGVYTRDDPSTTPCGGMHEAEA